MYHIRITTQEIFMQLVRIGYVLLRYTDPDCDETVTEQTDIHLIVIVYL